MQSNNEENQKLSVQPAEPAIAPDQKMLEDAFSKALAGFFPSTPSKSVETDPRAEFFKLYKRESEEFNKGFIKKHDEDANTTLIFAGLFSAVTSAFLIDARKNLQQDYAPVSAALLQILVYKVIADFPLAAWNGPSSTMVNTKCLLYASLAASLIAFGAMLGKQWINRYSRVDNRGSLIMDRSRDRQRKFDGMMRWDFDWVMESLPLMLQAALLLLGLTLSLYLWTIFTQVGAIYASIFIPAVVECDDKHSKYMPTMSKRLRPAVERFCSIITGVGEDLVVKYTPMWRQLSLRRSNANKSISAIPRINGTNLRKPIADTRCIC